MMLECEMYPLFINWLESNTDIWMHEPLIPATCCFDFIAVQGKHVIVYELKVSNAKQVIYQANKALLWCDHSYAVLPEDKIHLGIKYCDMLREYTGLMSLNMTDFTVKTIIEPESKNCHITARQLRSHMIQWILRDYVNRHQDFIANWKRYSINERTRSEHKKKKRKPFFRQ